MHQAFVGRIQWNKETKGGERMTFRELCAKEIVQLQNGACLGKADDLELDPETAQVQSLLLFGQPHLFGLLGRDETLTIPWSEIEKIGLDAVLVRTNVPPPAPKKPSLWQKLRQWWNG